ncbi:MAG: MBOAT family O-acyltransferase [Luteolibacter sp.]
MVFSSHLFLFVFLPLVLAGYYVMPKKGRSAFLTIFSYIFYGWANPLFVLLMLLSTAIDYFAGRTIAMGDPRNRGENYEPLDENGPRSRMQKTALWASIISNLSLLGFFKYFNFGIENLSKLFEWFGWSLINDTHFLHVVLPLGISFYTFQSMSYAIDVYRGHAKPLKNFVDFACYISLFPQLVAGPIIRYQDVADQLVSRTHTLAKFSRGIAFFSIGLAKKVLIANPCGRIADTVHDSASITCLDAWTGLFAYSFQIYFDFSGYSDMAVGLGLMLGFVFIRNFNSPYRSKSLTEFWQRWHISLSTWLRDYLYIPLGGNRKGPTRTYINLLLVMLIGGLWHGASWNFLIWGGMHGLWLALERFCSKRVSFSIPSLLRCPLTFVFVSVMWIPFRSSDLESALHYTAKLWPANSPDAGLVSAAINTPYLLMSLTTAFIIAFFGVNSWKLTRHLRPMKLATCAILLVVAAAALTCQSYNPFIYFIF